MCAALTLLTLTLSATGPDPRELMRKADATHRIAFEQSVATMILQSSDGAKEQRSYEMFAAQNDRDGDKMVIRFKTPADVANTALLSVEDPKTKDDEQWLYLPAFKKTRRLGTSELGDRFVGSDLLFEDMKRRYVDDYDYVLLREESVDGQPCWVIEAKPSAPKVKAGSPYGMTHSWLRKDGLFVIKVRQFDKRMRPLKETVVREIVSVGGDSLRANRVEIVDVVRKHRTTIIIDKRDAKTPIADTVFSKHALEKT